MYITQRFDSLLSSVAVNVTATPAQVSGGTDLLSATSLTPSRVRQALRITNTGSTIIYIGSTVSVTPSNGGGWFKALNPREYFDDLVNGSVPRFLVCSSTSTATVEEYQ